MDRHVQMRWSLRHGTSRRDLLPMEWCRTGTGTREHPPCKTARNSLLMCLRFDTCLRVLTRAYACLRVLTRAYACSKRLTRRLISGPASVSVFKHALSHSRTRSPSVSLALALTGGAEARHYKLGTRDAERKRERGLKHRRELRAARVASSTRKPIEHTAQSAQSDGPAV